jgi:hypothetical protein
MSVSSIPPEMHERVLDMACQITNAALADDTALREAHYLSLLEYFEAQTDAGQGHPFLTETVADYTDDPVAALRYYQLALEQSHKLGVTEPMQTILIGIAEKLLELGMPEQAEARLHDGRKEAIRRNDEFAIAEADRLLKELPDRPAGFTAP